MAILFILAMVSALLLSFTGSLPFWASGAITVSCLFSLAVLGFYKMQEQRQLKRRGLQLRALWGLPVRHLGGLPLPLDTAGNLFLLQDQLLLDTEHDQQKISQVGLRQILIVTADQIRRIPDHILCEMLDTGSCRSFSSLREKIRQHDSALRRSGILMIAYQPAGEAADLLILATRAGSRRLVALLRQSSLAAQSGFIRQNGKTAIFCGIMSGNQVAF
jgi:hypothetical protein